MKRIRNRVIAMTLCMSAMAECTNLVAQEAVGTASGSMTAGAWAPMVAYNIGDKGVEQPVRWGIDTAWLWDWWPLRATNHMQECASLGRVTIDPRISGTYTALADDQRERLDLQLGWLEKSGVTDLYLLCGNASGTAWDVAYRASFIADIALGVEYLTGKGYNVVAIAPFNEPDYWANNAPAPEEMATVSRMLRENAALSHIDICGPNTLNPDYAYSWWGIMANDVQVGNTHQLAGSYDSFAGFYAAVAASGKKSAGDELHNINDALIGMNYGMSAGIWWSDYGGYTRAELGRASNDGARIGYKENRAAWTTAAVFKRYSSELVEAFLGTSERQAAESAFTFVSQDRLAYYDGYGPYYEYTKATPGGTGYQSGQTNSEYVIEITYGEDVSPAPISGKFKIVNKATGKLLSVDGGTMSNAAGVKQYADGKVGNQVWQVKAIDPRSSGDFSYVHISNGSYYLDGVKYAADNGARVQIYAGGGNECERWHLRYMGGGYYVITNHDSGLSLEGSADNTDASTADVVQWARTGSDRQLWRFVPAEAEVESIAPAMPTGLQATPQSGSISLAWNANEETDCLGYMVYRYNEGAGIWETIGRQVPNNAFIDNICAKGKSYRYRVRAIDKAWNLSEPSAEIQASTDDAPAMTAHWSLAGNLNDSSDNLLHATATDITYATDDIHEGAVLDGVDDYISLPYHVADMQELTFSAWVKPTRGDAWQRIFDFGRNTDNNLFLTPSNGQCMRFEICKDGIKQGLNATMPLSPDVWTHVTLTTAKGRTCLYINGKLDASTADIAYTPADIAPSLCYIGRSMYDADLLLQGTVGEVCLYNYALSEEQVADFYYRNLLDDAIALTTRPMNKAVKTTLTDAIETLSEAVDAGNENAISTAVQALGAAMDKAYASVEAYKPLCEALEWSAQMAETYPQNNAEANERYKNAYETVYGEVCEGAFGHNVIDRTIQTIHTFTNTFLMADAVDEATESRPVDITHLLQNSTFDNNTTEGWSIVTGTASYMGAAAYGCLEFWNSTFDVAQTLQGMPSGTYRLRAQGFYRNGAKENSADKTVHAVLYVDTTTATIAPISRGALTNSSNGNWYKYNTTKYVPNDMAAAAAAFKANKYIPTSTVNNVVGLYDAGTTEGLRIGMKKDVAIYDDWTIVNYFKLHYLGREDTSIEILEPTDNRQRTAIIYDLAGRQVDGKPCKGVYIVDGKKIVIK